MNPTQPQQSSIPSPATPYSTSNMAQVPPNVHPDKKLHLAFFLRLIAVFTFLAMISMVGMVSFLFIRDRLIYLPIDPHSTELEAAGVSYSLLGNITSLSDTNDGKVIHINSNMQNLPPLLITNRTTVYKQLDGRLSQVNTDELKVNQRVSVNIYYHLIHKIWLTTIVYIR